MQLGSIYNMWCVGILSSLPAEFRKKWRDQSRAPIRTLCYVLAFVVTVILIRCFLGGAQPKVAGEDKDILREAFKQACEVRQGYITMRFALLTLFTALTGGLMAVAFNKDHAVPANSFGLIRFLGALIAAVGIFGDARISYLIWYYHSEVQAWANVLHIAPVGDYGVIHSIMRIFDTVALCSIYVVVIIFWIMAEPRVASDEGQKRVAQTNPHAATDI